MSGNLNVERISTTKNKHHPKVKNVFKRLSVCGTSDQLELDGNDKISKSISRDMLENKSGMVIGLPLGSKKTSDFTNTTKSKDLFSSMRLTQRQFGSKKHK